ncbi:MAG: hypothetical protein ACPGR8_15105, partial [Limisphaerales bacterium]
NIMLLSAVFFVLFFSSAVGSARDAAVQAGICVLALCILGVQFLERDTNKNRTTEKLLKYLVVPVAGTCLLLGRRAGQEELHLDMACILSAAAIL